MSGGAAFKERSFGSASNRIRKIASLSRFAAIVEERDTTLTSPSSACKSVVALPLNALMYDQISSLREKAVQAAILGVKEAESDEHGDSPVTITSQWEGTRGRIIQAEYEIVFSHPEAFLSREDGLEVLQSTIYQP